MHRTGPVRLVWFIPIFQLERLAAYPRAPHPALQNGSASSTLPLGRLLDRQTLGTLPATVAISVCVKRPSHTDEKPKIIAALSFRVKHLCFGVRHRHFSSVPARFQSLTSLFIANPFHVRRLN